MDAIGILEIRNFLRTNPSRTIPAIDQNAHTPGEKYGITTAFRDGSTHWPAFTRLLVALKPYILSTSMMFSISHPEDYRKEKAIRDRRLPPQDPALAIRHNSDEDCFETVRLSANIAPASCPRQTTHPSKLASMVSIGRRQFIGGDIAVPALGMLHTLKPGGFLVLHASMEVHTKPFSGEGFKLQFFTFELEDYDLSW
ncbi:hypothetical protein N431DRAFT_540331 [Stipitochalara longipes BDJ]|nr:hypothetical protein N431DRAFT_540331 [Stipitochalara longipes BDJ]